MNNNLINQKFGKLLVLEKAKSINKKTRYICMCDCGNKIETLAASLKNNKTKSCGCFRKEQTSLKFKKDLSGREFGRLLVIQKSVNKQSSWECRCECGNTKDILSKYLLKGKVNSCGCLKKEKLRARLWKGYKEFDGQMIYNIKKGAFLRNLECSIDLKYLWELYEKQERKCALSGINLNFKKNHAYSVDRIDSNIGYIDGNIQIVHKDINRMKLDYSQKEFLQICNDIYDYQKYGVSTVEAEPKRKLPPRKTICGEINMAFYNRLVSKAKSRNISVDIIHEDLWDLFLKQNKKCIFSGKRLYFANKVVQQTASVDRIDSKKDYTINNIQFVHKDINMIKQIYSNEYFLEMVYKIVKYNE